MATFAERFKQLRKDANFTQEEIAAKLNVSKGTIGNYETGTRSPRKLEDLEAIADLFNVEIDYLLGRTDSKPVYTLEEVWIIDRYRVANENTKAAIKLILR